MVERKHYDLVVIGTGPGGEGAAMEACKQGLRVGVVERYALIGGGCTHWGTIPSKALRSAIYQLTETNSNPIVSKRAVNIRVSFQELRESAYGVIKAQVGMRRSFYDRNSVDVHFGHASFTGPNEIEVTDAKGAKLFLTFKGCVIATGSRPYHPPDVDFTHPRILDSDTLLGMNETPRVITIYGAGVIGCEYASMLSNLRVKVNLVNTRDQLLDFLDDEITDALSYHMRDRGIRIRHQERYEKIEGLDDGVILHLASGKKLKSDVLLFALGRTGNSDNLGLENINATTDSRGQIQINTDFQVKDHKHIYAVGDIVGPPALASAAYVQGRYAAHHHINGFCERGLAELIPTGIYTSPEISSVGRTERQLTEAGIPYEVGHSMFKHLARSQIIGREVGMLKILFHRETLEILGVHCFGANAAEIIHIGQAIMSQPGENNTLKYFINSTFNYPTMAEAYRVAALNGFNRLF